MVTEVLGSRKQLVKLALMVSVVAVATVGLSLRAPRALATSATLKPTLVSQAVSQAHPSLTAPASTATSAPAAAPAATPTVKVAAAPSCTPDTAYDIPAQLNVTGASAGLTQVVDAPAYYQIYGNSSAQIHAQLQQCAPGDEFSGVTGYSLVWQYDTTNNGEGTCTISNVKVGLHINMALPQWQASTTALPGLASEWQKFITGLTTHENGHVAIDQQYTNQLLNDLQTYPASDCGSFATGIQARANADVASLNSANDAYDARTNHGATQGAILP